MELEKVFVRCLVPGTVTAVGKQTGNLYLFKDNKPVEVFLVDWPDLQQAVYTSGGCCGAPPYSTPFFQIIE